jgi:hypothetical protein
MFHRASIYSDTPLHPLGVIWRAEVDTHFWHFQQKSGTGLLIVMKRM